MDEDRARFVVCYDVPDDNRRTKLARWLDGFGDRVQYSVFECWLSGKELARMLEGVRERMVEDEDRVSLYALCRRCQSEVVHLGRGGDGPRPGEERVWVV